MSKHTFGSKSGVVNGVSIRTLSIILIITAVLFISVSFFEVRRIASQAHSLYQFEQERHKCDSAIQQLMDGSDYLTAQVEQYVIKGERVYMDNYWNEVYITKSRDKAIDTILNSNITPEERVIALAGKDESDTLINGEIWAMRMVSESIGLIEADMPADVAKCELSEADAALTQEEKKVAAISYVFGPDYSLAKDEIRGNVNSFRNEVSNRYSQDAIDSLNRTEKTTHYMAVCLFISLFIFVGEIVFFIRLVLLPLSDFAVSLKGCNEGKLIALNESGAAEIRQFAKVFNALSSQVQQNTSRLERLGYYDFLTDMPNRASITEYVTELIDNCETPLGLMMIDIDNFKLFNDTYGHAIGDLVLKNVAKAISSAQNEKDGIAGRLCGEEFVFVLKNAQNESLHNAAEAILQKVRSITGECAGLPDDSDFIVRVSIGGMVWNGEQPCTFSALLSKADKALYTSKRTGKDKYTFYGDIF